MTLTLGDDGRPTSALTAAGRTDFFEWEQVDERWLPLRQRGAAPPVTHRWSEIVFDAPVPERLRGLE